MLYKPIILEGDNTQLSRMKMATNLMFTTATRALAKHGAKWIQISTNLPASQCKPSTPPPTCLPGVGINPGIAGSWDPHGGWQLCVLSCHLRVRVPELGMLLEPSPHNPLRESPSFGENRAHRPPFPKMDPAP